MKKYGEIKALYWLLTIFYAYVFKKLKYMVQVQNYS